jgi:peptidoglycan/LPS O-acetylase OafA/YrhL
VFTANRLGLAYFHFSFLGVSDQVRSGGLDFFFLLSGFIIFHTYHRQVGEVRLARQFLLKRFLRIYPVYWYILISLIPLSPFFSGKQFNASTIAKSILLLPQDHPLLPTAWSLGHLLLFYLMFAVLLVLGRSTGTVIVSLWFLGIVINFTQGIFHDNPWLDFLFSKYHLYFFIGGFTAHITRKVQFKHPGLLVPLGAAGLVLAILNADRHLFPLDDLYNYGIPVTVFLSGLAMLDDRKEWKIPGFFNFLGQASYSLYLSHYPVLLLLCHFAAEGRWFTGMELHLAMALLIVAAVVVGFATHVLIEKPLLSFIFFRRNIQLSSDSYLMRKSDRPRKPEQELPQ